MTVEIERVLSPSVFDAGLPSISYLDAGGPAEAYKIISQVRRRAPIALGPHGPEVLTYELVHKVLRDPDFACPKGSPSRHRASRRDHCGTGPPRA